MGTITKTIGSSGGRDYSTVAAWAAALPANLVTDGNSQIGACYNDGATELTSGWSISGNTTDATHTITLKCGAGQSINDQPNTTALTYDATKGVAFKQTGNYASVALTATSNTFIQGIQFKHTAQIGSVLGANGGIVATGCIFDRAFNNVGFHGNGQIDCYNNVYYDRATAGITIFGGRKFVNNTVICVSGGGGTGLVLNYGNSSNVVKNNMIFGFTNMAGYNGGSGSSAFNCITDAASVGVTSGGGNLVSKTLSNQVVNTTSDFRLKTGADAIDAGLTDTTDIPSATDFFGTARPQGSAWDIGAYELAASGAFVFSYSDACVVVESISLTFLATASQSGSSASSDTATGAMLATASQSGSSASTDATTGNGQATAAPSDATAATDTTAGQGNATAAPTDTAASTDANTGAGRSTAALSDTTAATDTLTGFAILAALLADTKATTDLLSVIASGSFFFNLSDTAASSDATTATASMAASVMDAAATSDGLSGASLASVSLGDITVSADSAGGAASAFTAALRDAVASGDALTFSGIAQLIRPIVAPILLGPVYRIVQASVTPRIVQANSTLRIV